MQNSYDAGARRPVILYIIIAIALFAALILTVRWAKNRADYYAQAQTGQSQPVAEEGGQPQVTPETSPVIEVPSPQPQPQQQSQPAPRSTESHTSAPTPTAVANTGPPTVQVVPSTGPEQLVLPIFSLSAVVFAGLSYVRTRRRFREQALAR
jgi:hypothetical protein